MSADRCTVYKYTCSDPRINALTAAVIKQQDANHGFDEAVLPWKLGCKDKDFVHFVAQSQTTGMICGWLVAGFTKQSGYIYEISTRRIKDSYYGGIGQALHREFLDEAWLRGVDFVYLFPLNESVAEVYATPVWGYTRIDPDLNHMFRSLRARPSKEFLDNLKGTRPEILLERTDALASAKPADPYLRRLVVAGRPYVLTNRGVATELESLLEQIEGTIAMGNNMGEPYDVEALRGELSEFFTNLLRTQDVMMPRKIRTVRTRKHRRHTRRKL